MMVNHCHDCDCNRLTQNGRGRAVIYVATQLVTQPHRIHVRGSINNNERLRTI